MSYILLFVLLILSYLLGSIQGSFISSKYIYKDDKVLRDWQEYKSVHTFTRERIWVVVIDGIKVLIPVLILFLMAPILAKDYLIFRLSFCCPFGRSGSNLGTHVSFLS